MSQKPSLLRANPILFSPLYLNAEKFSTEKILALNRVVNLFFPQAGSGLVKTILNMEKHGERLSVDCSPEERRKLIREMKGMSMDIQYVLSDEGQKMMEISIHIVPSEVLEQAQQGMTNLITYQKLSDDFDKMIFKLVIKKIRRRFTLKVMDYFQTIYKNNPVPSFITKLLDIGWINRKGKLLKGTSIDDLLTGKYHKQFMRLMPEEILQEGRQIRETIKTCFVIGQDDADSLIQDAKKRHFLLEIVIQEFIVPQA